MFYLPDARAESGDERSRVEHAGLRVEFSPRCADHSVQLHGLITNESAEPITIQSGSFPWQYDVLGSEFIAEASGKTLKRSAAAPILGRVGPITLMPREHQEGLVPISTLFPDLRNALKKGAAVTIHWKYWTGVKSARSAPFEGEVVVQRNPCAGER